MKKRVAALRRLLAAAGLDGLIVTDLANVRWLSGFSGSNGLVLVTRRAAWFCTDFRYEEQSRLEVKGLRVAVLRRGLFEELPLAPLSGCGRVGVEKHHLSLSAFAAVRRRVRPAGVRLVPARNFTLELRRTKDEDEVRLIRAAQRHTDRVFREVLPLVRPGVRESELGAEITARFSRVGENAFRPIVASGPNGAKPHAGVSNRRLRPGDAVTFDIGCRYRGYCSDMTRTVFVARPPHLTTRPPGHLDTLFEVYHIVLEAQRRALALVRPGVACAEVDRAARQYIADTGYGPQFGHGLGHGVGLEVHERPNAHPRSGDTLAPGDVITIEPGIYLPGLGGVRIEDMVLVTKTGCRNLTRSPKQLLVTGDARR
ncbi:MAG TPA: aminopeptidase P family protein [candidate division WOR-3 bacterium]|uniref:Aminopeptidase P family protein n=1 Tax=candidate division WOR-3 bacterium TaxID=2052148 RepID=A0A7V0T6W5_UNCW3|nr:aminopeptidase P family protein [candidate division WOR-3 bacterium]